MNYLKHSFKFIIIILLIFFLYILYNASIAQPNVRSSIIQKCPEIAEQRMYNDIRSRFNAPDREMKNFQYESFGVWRNVSNTNIYEDYQPHFIACMQSQGYRVE